MGWVFIVLGLLIRTPMTVMTLGFTLPVPAGLRLEHHGRPGHDAGLAARLRGANPISWVTTAIRGLMGGGATLGQVALALVGPAVLTAALAPVTLWLYARK